VRKDSRRVEAKRKHLGEARGVLYPGGEIILLEDTQAMLDCPSDEDRM
jgi:hypothetical protein